MNVNRIATIIAAALMLQGCLAIDRQSADSLATLAAADERQRAMVASADVDGLAALAHPNLLINSPNNVVLNREQFLANMRAGQIGAESFERAAERVTVENKIGIVMGRETFTPTATSELGRTFGSRPLKRRYTNIYLWDGRWRWIARHANVVVNSR